MFWNKVTIICAMFLHCAPKDNASVLSEHSEFFIPVTILVTLNPCKSRPSEGNNQAIKYNFCQLRVLILVANTSTGDTYATTSCCLTMCISNQIAYTYQVAHIELHTLGNQVAE